MRHRVSWALWPLLALTACAPGRDLPPLPSPATHAYRLGPGDSVRVITYGEDPLTGDFKVNEEGDVALPLAGRVAAAGKTPEELGRSIAAVLARKQILVKPSVSVQVDTYRPIYILGEVNKPGAYPYQPDMTMVTAAALAGGFTYRAVRGYASVVRTVDGDSVEGKVSRQAFLQPGDVVTVFERHF
jgi:polysaccharide biosynthesis/export protein